RSSNFHVELPASITIALPPPRAMTASNEARVRKDGLKKSMPRSLSRKCFGCGLVFQALAVDKIRLTVSRPRSDRRGACFILSSLKFVDCLSQRCDRFIG